jgi:NAD(P)-dependent dehydrogenase (short-subunit alcohol dehydrogenase family)
VASLACCNFAHGDCALWSRERHGLAFIVSDKVDVNTISLEFSDRVFVVTGAAGALGAAVVSALQGYGAKVAKLDHGAAKEAADPLSIGGLNLADDSAAETAMTSIVKHAGAIDGLVNIAGGFQFQKLQGGTLEMWDAMYQQNLRSAVACCKAALPHLIASQHGRIVNISALAAAKAGAGMGPYAASKAGVARLTESLAEELKDQAVTVNAILPSMMDTARNRSDMPTADFSRWVKTSAVADLIAFLLSDSAAAITGALIPITGRT